MLLTLNHHEAGEIDTYEDKSLRDLISETLETYWEDPKEVGFLIADKDHRLVATLTTTGTDGSCEGTVEVYVVGEGIEQYNVKYNLTEDGRYYSSTVARV